ncbi:hypothetical protein GS500_09820 [Rhodococcus hoagii]|nr:hypothetical protein [Prescottella equi]
MGELILQLLPELAGMAVTPAAIAGCVLLLQTKRPLANALAFATAFMIAYTAIGVAALLGGATHDTSRSGDVSHWAGLGVGLIFVAFGVGQLVRRRSPSDTGPEWMQQLSNAKPRGAFIMGAALSIVNPNLAIMISGTTVIAVADTTPGTAVFGTVLLLSTPRGGPRLPRPGRRLPGVRRPCEERALRGQGVDDHARAAAHAHCLLRFRRVVRGAERGGPDLTLRLGWCVDPPRTRASRRR